MPRILLADDSTHAQRMGAKILAAEGFEVTTVSNGKAAIDAMKQSAPDLVIADVFMPGRNGYEVCQHVKTSEDLKRIPVVLIIGAMEPYDPDEGKKAGADAVITKPLESSKLVETVKGLLEASKRFAPAKPKVKKVKPKEAVASTVSDPYGPVEEDPAWAAEEEITTTGPREEELVIPEGMSQQPVGMLTDLLGPSAETVPSVEVPEVAEEDTGPPSFPVPEVIQQSVSVPEVAAPPSPPSEVEEIDDLDSSTAQIEWTAEAAAVTAEDEKLFEKPVASWSELTKLAEQEAPASAAPLPWQTDPDLIQPEAIPAETGTELGIEHYDNLNDTVAAHSPISFSALGIGVEPISLGPQPEASAADSALAPPASSDEIILSPADAPVQTLEGAGETISGPIDPGYDRGFEQIVPSFEMLEPVSPPAAEPESVPAPVAQTAPDAAPDTAKDPLVEAAVAMVREATQKELAAEAASSGADAAPPLDPATLEHVIRGVVGQLMPQIVAQVKSALKN